MVDLSCIKPREIYTSRLKQNRVLFNTKNHILVWYQVWGFIRTFLGMLAPCNSIRKAVGKIFASLGRISRNRNGELAEKEKESFCVCVCALYWNKTTNSCPQLHCFLGPILLVSLFMFSVPPLNLFVQGSQMNWMVFLVCFLFCL